MTSAEGRQRAAAEAPDHWLTRGVVFAVACALTLSAVFYFRTLYRFHTPFVRILAWQAVAWAPWVPMFAWGHRALDWCLAERTHAVTYSRLALGAGTVGVVAAVWLRLASEHLSPFLGVQASHMGVFRFFFIFWFLLQGLLFLVVAGWRVLGRATLPPALAGSAGGLDPAPGPPVATTEAGPAREERLALSDRDGDTVELAQVLWIEARDYYSAVHLEGRKVRLFRRSLASLAEELSGRGFVRIHRSSIVNLRRLDRIDRPAHGRRPEVVLTDGTVRRISRAGARSLKAAGRLGA